MISVIALALIASAAVQLPQWSLEQEFRLGSVDDSAYALSLVTGITIGVDGRVLVSQGVDRNIRVYDAHGRFIRVLGGPGDGPGQFRGLGSASWRSDTLYVVDHDLQRVVLFDTAGRALNTRAWKPPDVGFPLRSTAPLALLANGTGVVRPSSAFDPRRDVGTARIPVLRADMDGRILDTLAVLPPIEARMIRGGTRMAIHAQAFPRDPLVRVTPTGDRVFVIDYPTTESREAELVRVRAFDADGKLIFDRRHAIPGVPIPRRVADSTYAAAITRLGTALQIDRRDAEDLARSTFPVPAAYPLVSAAAPSSDGSLWLAAWPNADESRRWYILDAQGRLVAQTEASERVTIRFILDGKAWGVELDELDVPFVVRYRVSLAARRDRADLDASRRSPSS